MSKTVDGFLEKFKSAVAAAPWSSATGYDARRAGIAAVVSALRDELYLDMGPGARWTPREVEIWFDQILGDAGEKVAGNQWTASTQPQLWAKAPATDPAPAVCEWTRISEFDAVMHYSTPHGVMNDLTLWRGLQCVVCHAPIKFKSEAAR